MADDQPKSEDLTGRSRMLSNVLTSWFAQVLIIIAGFFLPRIIDNNLGQFGLGIWDFAWSITSYVALAQLGIGSALNRFIAKYRAAGETSKLQMAVSTTVGIQWTFAVLVALAVVGIYYLIPVYLSEELGDGLEPARNVALYLGMSVAVQLLFDTSRGVLTGCHRWDIFNAINSATQVSCTITMIVMLMRGGSLTDIAIIYLAFAVLQGTLRTYAARRVCPEATIRWSAISRPFGREIFGYGIRSIMINLPGVLAHQSVNIATVSTMGPAALAILVRPGVLLRYIDTFVTKFTYILTPMAESVLSIEGKDRLLEFVKNTARYSFAMILPPITLFGVFGDEVIALWMGSDYVNRTIIWLLSIGAILSASQSAILRVVIGLDLHGPAAKRSIIYTIALLTSLLLIGWHQQLYSIEFFAGCVLANSAVIQGLYLPAYSCRKLKIPFADYLRAVFPFSVVIVLLLGIALAALDYFLDPALLQSALYGAGYLALCAVIYWMYLIPKATRSQWLALLARA